MRKGFTLIELLIVIAIIGILSSSLLVGLGGARKQARDARRLADLKNVQAALELYFNKCARYPGDDACNPSNPSNWGVLKTILQNANIGTNQIPNDPAPGQNYRYSVTTTDGQRYLLGATLESDNQVLKSDLDNSDVSSAGFSPAPACDDVSDPYNYCLGI